MEQNRNIVAESVFSLMKGRWALKRHIDGEERMSGTAEYTETLPDRLAYSECGTHLVDGRTALEFYQAYRVRLLGDHLHVNFSDGRPFHSLSFQEACPILKAEALHLCGNDTYRGEYVFHDDDRFTVFWTVSGPRKNYRIETRYFRQGPC